MSGIYTLYFPFPAVNNVDIYAHRKADQNIKPDFRYYNEK